MPKPLVFFLALFCLVQSFFAQELIPYRKGKLWGFADTNGKLIVKPKYSKVFYPRCDIITVMLGDQYGVINREGKTIIPPGDYDYIEASCGINNAGIIILKPKGENKYELHDRNGAYLTTVREFTFNGGQRNGPNLLVKNGGFGLISNTGTWLVKPQPYEIELLKDGSYLVRGDSLRFFDALGKRLGAQPKIEAPVSVYGYWRSHYYKQEHGFTQTQYSYLDKDCLARTHEKDLGQVLDIRKMEYRPQTAEEACTFTVFRVYNRQGKNILPKGYRNHYLADVSKGFLLVYDVANRKGIIDTSGNLVVPSIYNDVVLQDGCLQIQHGGVGAVVPGSWKIIEPTYDHLLTFNGEAYLFKKNNLYYVVDTSGTLQNTEGYTRVGNEYKNGFVAWRNGRLFWLNKAGKILLEKDSAAYAYAYPFENGYSVVGGHQSGLGLLNTLGQEVQPTVYVDINPIRPGYFWVSTWHGAGIVKEGKLLVDTIYNNLRLMPDLQHFLFGKGILWGLKNIQGETLIPMEYSKIELNHKGYYALEKINPEYARLYPYLMSSTG